jgi:isoquinoline 1-oxidoreductase beta subunit
MAGFEGEDRPVAGRRGDLRRTPTAPAACATSSSRCARSAERFEAGIDKNNKVIAWRHRNAAPSLFANFMPDPKYPGPVELGMGFVDTPFNIPNIRLESGEAQSHVRVGWFRSVNNVAHAWSIQSLVAELAHELGRDQKDFLLELIGPARIVDAPEKATTPWWDYGEPHDVYPINTARLRHVAELAAERAGWGRTLPKGHRGASRFRELHRHGGRGRGG